MKLKKNYTGSVKMVTNGLSLKKRIRAQFVIGSKQLKSPFIHTHSAVSHFSQFPFVTNPKIFGKIIFFKALSASVRARGAQNPIPYRERLCPQNSKTATAVTALQQLHYTTTILKLLYFNIYYRVLSYHFITPVFEYGTFSR